MKGLSKLKAWMKRKGFTSTDYRGNSEYFNLDGFPATIRLADHLGRKGTETDKYINIIPDGLDSYVFSYDRVVRSMTHKELIKTLESLIYLHKSIPLYFTNRDQIKKLHEKAVNEVESKLAQKNVAHRATLVKALTTLTPVVADLQKLCSSFKIEKEKL